MELLITSLQVFQSNHTGVHYTSEITARFMPLLTTSYA